LILLLLIQFVEFLLVTVPTEFFVSKLSTACIYIFPIQNNFYVHSLNGN